VPLVEHQGLGIVLLSYDGRLYWGFLADPSTIPDLHVYSIAVSFSELLEAIGDDNSAAGRPTRCGRSV